MKKEVSRDTQKIKVLALQKLNEVRGGQSFGMDAASAPWSTISLSCLGGSWSTLSDTCR